MCKGLVVYYVIIVEFDIFLCFQLSIKKIIQQRVGLF